MPDLLIQHRLMHLQRFRQEYVAPVMAATVSYTNQEPATHVKMVVYSGSESKLTTPGLQQKKLRDEWKTGIIKIA